VGEAVMAYNKIIKEDEVKKYLLLPSLKMKTFVYLTHQRL
jgi:hypothetical protein